MNIKQIFGIKSRSKKAFSVGDHIIVSSGYDSEPAWLKGGPGYTGIITDIKGNRAVVKLDQELNLSNESQPWQDFGKGSDKPQRQTSNAKGSWLVLTLGYKDAEWSEPIQRLQIGLCIDQPEIDDLPVSYGIGVWLESHATIKRSTQ